MHNLTQLAESASPSTPAPIALTAHMGDWLDSLPWCHFATLTFGERHNEASARRAFARYVRRVEQRAQERCTWFAAFEGLSEAELPHVHALLNGTSRLGVDAVRSAWRGGIAEVRVYKASHGAAHYVAKHLGSERADYDFNLGRPPERHREISDPYSVPTL